MAACPWASICPHRILDVLPYAKATAARLAACRELDNLPRKFKITFSGCGGDCGQPYINCVGVVAVVRRRADGREEKGFRVVIGGGMGWKAFVAQPLYSFVPPEKIVEVCRAVGLLFRDHGDRYIRMYARLKFVVHRLGIDRCRELVNEYLDQDGVDRSGFGEQPIEYCRAAGSRSPPVRCRTPAAPTGWPSSRSRSPRASSVPTTWPRSPNCRKSTATSTSTARTGRTSNCTASIRAACRSCGRKSTPWAWRPTTSSGSATWSVASARPIARWPSRPRTRCSICFSDLVHDPKYAPIRDRVLVNITGCPNSCSPYRIADIGLRGLRIREKVGSTEGYLVTVGGTQAAVWRSGRRVQTRTIAHASWPQSSTRS